LRSHPTLELPYPSRFLWYQRHSNWDCSPSTCLTSPDFVVNLISINSPIILLSLTPNTSEMFWFYLFFYSISLFCRNSYLVCSFTILGLTINNFIQLSLFRIPEIARLIFLNFPLLRVHLGQTRVLLVHSLHRLNTRNRQMVSADCSPRKFCLMPPFGVVIKFRLEIVLWLHLLKSVVIIIFFHIVMYF
jgi:hypothetical protein